ncbi:DHA2 family efflux MFS transporter permease subunit [Kitasatospora sp. NBC_00070]|uniref:MFS transporter n=1 Tax=Kitasatospora sp. NBC_00070 TaxID=2975962 RepID=UPI003247ACBD
MPIAPAPSATTRSLGAGARPPRRRHAPTAILLIVCAAQFMINLDASIVNVALPHMRQALHLTPAGQQWIVNAYTLGFAGLLLLGGRLADLVGTRRAFLGGLIVFTLASLVGGLASNGALLIGARAAQGAGGAFLAPATLTLVMTTFTEPRVRTRALGAWSAVTAGGGAAGAVLGGVLTQYVDWRWAFIVNVPLGIALLGAALTYLPAAHGRGGGLRGLDLPGALTVTAGLTALVYGIISTETHSWESPTVWGALATAVLLLAAFVRIETRSAAPLVPLSVFRQPSLAIANTAGFGLGAAVIAMWFLLSLYLQQILGQGALTAGLSCLPGCLAIVVGAQLSTRLVRRTGPRPLILTGAVLSTVGFLWLSRISADGSYAADVLTPLVLCTLGMGLAMMPLTIAATTGTHPSQVGLASGLISTSRQVGGAFGLAVLASIASHTTAAHGAATAQALTDGYGRALLAAAAFTAAAALTSLALPRARTR